MWRKWGTLQNFSLVFIDELEKQIFIKKNSWSEPIKKVGISIFTMLHLKKKKRKKNTWRYYFTFTYQKSWWYDSLWQTEIVNYRSLFALSLPPNNSENQISSCMLLEIRSVTDIEFSNFGPFFAILPHYGPWKINFGKNVTKP